MEIPYQRLSEDALRGVVEEFVTRDGTDYGAAEASLESKVAEVLRRLAKGEAALDFDPESGSCTIVVRPNPCSRSGKLT
ncbi:MAG: YheU family protein [Deltaproteobacteria bacterium]|nr:YheU family protein [Deltaproteobacteria bacterium]